MKKIIIIILTLGLIAWLLYTPDISNEVIEKQYTNANSKFLDLNNGTRIHYRDQGEPAGTALLLIHGTGASLHTWEPLTARLGQNFRLISLDLLGHGLTGQTTKRDYTPAAQIEAIIQLMDELGLSEATLVGNSFGGNIAWNLAMDYPDRVQSLVLIAPSGAPRLQQSDSNLGFKLLSSPIAQKLMLKVTPRWIVARSLRQTLEDDDLVTDAMIDRYWQLLRKSGNRQAMVDLARGRKASERWQRLADLKQEVLLIWGEQDHILPVSMSKTFISGLPKLRYEQLAEIGHIPMEEAPDTTAGLIRSFCEQVVC